MLLKFLSAECGRPEGRDEGRNSQRNSLKQHGSAARKGSVLKINAK